MNGLNEADFCFLFWFSIRCQSSSAQGKHQHLIEHMSCCYWWIKSYFSLHFTISFLLSTKHFLPYNGLNEITGIELTENGALFNSLATRLSILFRARISSPLAKRPSSISNTFQWPLQIDFYTNCHAHIAQLPKWDQQSDFNLQLGSYKH